eukprot:Clim_evm60s88 gene=Clim_evmTU60s88
MNVSASSSSDEEIDNFERKHVTQSEDDYEPDPMPEDYDASISSQMPNIIMAVVLLGVCLYLYIAALVVPVDELDGRSRGDVASEHLRYLMYEKLPILIKRYKIDMEMILMSLGTAAALTAVIFLVPFGPSTGTQPQSTAGASTRGTKEEKASSSASAVYRERQKMAKDGDRWWIDNYPAANRPAAHKI